MAGKEWTISGLLGWVFNSVKVIPSLLWKDTVTDATFVDKWGSGWERVLGGVHMCNISCGKSVIILKNYQKQSNLWKQQLITQGKLIQLVDINCYWMGLLLIAKPPITHKVNRIKIPHSNPRKLQLMYIYWSIKWKFQGTRNLLAVIGQLLIEVSHRVHFTCTCFKHITLHKFGKKCPTHRVHQRDLKTNQKK